jgi:hypothetical protein
MAVACRILSGCSERPDANHGSEEHMYIDYSRPGLQDEDEDEEGDEGTRDAS